MKGPPRPSSRALIGLLLLACGACSGAADGPLGAGDDDSTPIGAEAGRTVAATDPRFEFDLTIEGAITGLRMLTRAELARSIADLAGVVPDVSQLPEPGALFGLHNDAGRLQVQDVGHMQELLTMATTVAAEATIASVVPCQDAAAGCSAAEVADLLRRTFLSPVVPESIDRYFGVYQKARQQGNDAGDEFARRALLQSILIAPGFLYRTEIGAPRAPDTLDPVELGAKLSFFLWGAAPDAELRRSALDGTLPHGEAYDAQVERLLADPRTESRVARLVSEWLAIDDLDLAPKADAAGLPAGIEADLLEEVELAVREAVKGNLPLAEIFRAQETWVNESTATLYGKGGIKGKDFRKVSLADLDGRRGLLTAPAVLAAHGKEKGRSPMQRGRFLVNDLMCHSFSPEAGQPVMMLPESDGTQTFRQRFQPLETAAPCSYCHQALNAGFAFDIYDPVGRRYPESVVAGTEATGVFDLPPYPVVRFDDPRAAVEGLAVHPALGRCFVTQAYRSAQGRLPDSRDAVTLRALEKAFGRNGQNTVNLLREIVRSPSFRATVAR